MSRCDPCAFRPPLLHSLCVGGLASRASPRRETVHGEKAREGARDASLQRMDVAEESVGLYGDALETGREQSDRMGVTYHTSVLKNRQGDENFILLCGGEKYEGSV